jgi:ADP-ribose pyrophosphatase
MANGEFKYISGKNLELDDDFYVIENAVYETPSGESVKRVVMRHPGAATILPITNDNKIVLVNQFRPGVNQYVMEIPAGRFDKTDEPEAVTAERELLEETGYKAKSLDFFGSYFMTPGHSEEEMFFYIARGCEKVQEFAPDGGEEEWMTTHLFTYEEAKQMLLKKELKDVKTVFALTYFFGMIKSA